MPDITLHIKNEDEDTMHLQMGVISVAGKDGDDILNIGTGAGMGGDFITLVYRGDNGTTYRGICFMRDIAREWLKQIDSDAPPELFEVLEIQE